MLTISLVGTCKNIPREKDPVVSTVRPAFGKDGENNAYRDRDGSWLVTAKFYYGRIMRDWRLSRSS